MCHGRIHERCDRPRREPLLGFACQPKTSAGSRQLSTACPRSSRSTSSSTVRAWSSARPRVEARRARHQREGGLRGRRLERQRRLERRHQGRRLRRGVGRGARPRRGSSATSVGPDIKTNFVRITPPRSRGAGSSSVRTRCPSTGTASGPSRTVGSRATHATCRRPGRDRLRMTTRPRTRRRPGPRP